MFLSSIVIATSTSPTQARRPDISPPSTLLAGTEAACMVALLCILITEPCRQCHCIRLTILSAFVLMCVQQRQRWISLSFRQRAHPFGIDQPRELSARRWSYGRTFFSEPHHQQVRKQRAAPLCASALISAPFLCVCVWLQQH